MKLWAVASQWEVCVEDMDSGAVLWRPEPGNPPYLYAGRYRTKPEATEKLYRVLAHRFVGFDVPDRRRAILRGRKWPNDYSIRTAENADRKRDGYAYYPHVTYGSRERFYVVQTEGRRAYDVPDTYFPCFRCEGSGSYARHWKGETEPTKCDVCGGRGTLIERRLHAPTPDDRRLVAGPAPLPGSGAPVRSLV